jgi:hypothetical protein
LTLSIPLHPCQGEPPPSTLSSRPKRTRISWHAGLDMTACAAFRKESRMKFANAPNLDRKSGVAQGRDDKVEGGGPPLQCWRGMDRAGQ